MIWDLQASAGAAGQSILWRGPWNSAFSYNPYNAVFSGGSSYISKTNNANKNPAANPSDWDLLASVGAQGPQGELGGLPVGTMVDYGGIIEPEGWLWCAGQIIPRTGIYAPLWGAIGDRWGAGDGVTTFQLPDWRGRVRAGRDDMGGIAANRLQVTQSCSTANGNATLTIEDYLKLTVGMFIYGPGIPAGTTITTFLSGTTLTMSTPATATASGIPLRFSYLDPQLLGSAGGSIIHQLSTNEMPYHYHSDYYQYLSYPGSHMQPGPAGGSYTLSAGSTTTSGVGGSWAHPNTQPTGVCNTIIKYAPPGTTVIIAPGTGDVTGPPASTDGELAVFNGTSGKFIRRGGMLPGGYHMPRGHLAALKTSNNPVDQVNDIDVQDGECRDSTNTVDIVLPSAMTKRIDAFWSAGTGQGGLDQTGALVNQSYHIFAIKNVNTTEVDVLFSPSATNPLLPTGFTHKRRIGSFLRIAGVIARYFQEGNHFYLGQPAKAVENHTLTVGTSAVEAWGNSCIPLGITGMAIGYVLGHANTSWCSPLIVPTSANPTTIPENPYAPYSQPSPSYGHMGFQVLFDVTASVKVFMIGNPGTVGTYWVSILGWIDPRGRES